MRTIASVFDINAATSTSVSIITPGHVTLPVIKTALLELGTPFVWLQVSGSRFQIPAVVGMGCMWSGHNRTKSQEPQIVVPRLWAND